MKRLRTMLFPLCACLVLFTAPAFAQSKLYTGDETTPDAGPNCDYLGYKSFEMVGTFPIPDNLPAAGVTIGPISTPADGDIINDVIIDLRINHTWFGDIIATVTYDQDCEGPLAGIPVRFICRPRGTAAGSPAPCGTTVTAGASGDLTCNNTLLFSDEALVLPSDGINPNPVPAGCYRPAPGTSFSVYRGLPKGGCWYLYVTDNAALDQGSVCQWSVHLRNQRPVPALPVSWGEMKGIYR